MGKRSGVLDHEADFMKATLAELDSEIVRCETMRKIATSARNRKSLESRLHWLGRIQPRPPALTSS